MQRDAGYGATNRGTATIRSASGKSLSFAGATASYTPKHRDAMEKAIESRIAADIARQENEIEARLQAGDILLMGSPVDSHSTADQLRHIDKLNLNRLSEDKRGLLCLRKGLGEGYDALFLKLWQDPDSNPAVWSLDADLLPDPHECAYERVAHEGIEYAFPIGYWHTSIIEFGLEITNERRDAIGLSPLSLADHTAWADKRKTISPLLRSY